MVYYYLLPHNTNSIIIIVATAMLLLHYCHRYFHCTATIATATIATFAATFNTAGYTDIATLEDAYALLSPILGTTAASTIFAVALLCSGQVNRPLTYSNYVHSPLHYYWTTPPPPPPLDYPPCSTRLLITIFAVALLCSGQVDGPLLYWRTLQRSSGKRKK